MDPQEGDIARGPNGETAVFRGGQWVVQGSQPQAAQGQPPVPGFVPFAGPAEQRAAATAERADRREERMTAAEERRIQMDALREGRQDIESETGLRREFLGLPAAKEFPIIDASYRNVVATANNDSAAGDLSLIFAFMKILDPNSVVREQEFANAQNAAGVPDQIRNVYNRALNGERLSPNQRADFVAQARSVYENRAVAYNELAERYRGLAEGYGFAPDNVALPVEISTDPVSANRQSITEEEANDPNLLSAQGYVYDGETDTWVRDVNARPDTVRQETAVARSEDMGLARRADTFTRGVADTLTFGLSDEIAAGLDTVIPLNQGRTGWQYGFPEAYRHNLSRERGAIDADVQDMPITRTAGQVTGGVMAPGAMTGGRFIAAAPNLIQATGRGAMVGGAAGAAYGAGSAEGGLSQRIEGAGEGGVMGAAIGGPLAGAGRGVGSVVGGQARRMMTSPRAQAVQTLQDYGVPLTPGRRFGGIVETAENVGQRLPIMGPAIRGARERGVEGLNRAQGNRALDAINEGVPADISVGGEMVGHVRDRLGAEFDRAYSMVPEIDVNDPALIEGLGRIGRAKLDLPPAMREQFDNIVSERLQRLQGATTGQNVGAVRSELNNLASGYLKSQDPAQQGLGRMIAELGDELDGAISRANPEAGKILSQARDGYADYVILERASTAAGGRPFQPGQLESAVRASDSSVRRGAVGRGEARGQNLSAAARMVMPDQFGNPGSADVGATLALGALHGANLPAGLAADAALIGGASYYSTLGREIVERLPANASRRQLEGALSELDQLARQDSNVISLRDEIARRIGRMVPAAAQQGVAQERLMTGTANR